MAVNKYKKVKGDPTGRYTQRILICEDDGSEIKIDIFMCRRENFGLMLAIRTGPAEYSHMKIAKGALAVGMKIQGGMLTENGEPISVPDEETLFKLLRIPHLPPEERA